MEEKITLNLTETWLMAPDPDAIGKQLRSMRLKHGLTQEKLSELLSMVCDHTVSRNAVSSWENGKKMLSLEHVLALAEMYGCSLDELVLSYRRSSADGDGDQPVPLHPKISKTVSAYSLFLCPDFGRDFFCGEFDKKSEQACFFTERNDRRKTKAAPDAFGKGNPQWAEGAGRM